MRRRLLDFLTVLSLLLAVAVCVMWPWSYRERLSIAEFGREPGVAWAEAAGGRLYLANDVTGRHGHPAGGPVADVGGFAYATSASGSWLSLPLWSIILLASFLPCWRLFGRRRRIGEARLRGGLCAHCGYDLRATPGRCPECGREAAGVE